MLDIAYNGILFFMLAMCLLGMFKLQGPKRLTIWARTHSRLVVGVLWAALISFVVGYLVFFSALQHEHDIPQAVSAAVNGLDNGLNPYVDEVVPRFETHDGLGFTIGMGTYNYLPLDLLVYSGMHNILGFAGFPAWFILSNLAFLAMAFYVFHELVPVKWASYLPFAGIVSLFYSFDNCSLTILLMVLSVYVLTRLKSNYSAAFSVFLMGLAIMTKVYAAIPFAVLVIWLLQEQLRARQPREALKIIGGVGSTVAAGALLVLPFGMTNVLNSAVFFHLSASTRFGTASGGTVLAELAMNSPYYVYIALGAVIAALIATMRVRDLYDRIMLVSFVFLIVVVKNSLSLVTIPGIYLAIRFYSWSHDARVAEDEPVVVVAPTRVSKPHGDDTN